MLAVKNKKIWMGTSVALLSLLMVAIFPKTNGFQGLMINAVFLFLLPIIFIRFFLRQKLNDFGLGLGDVSKGVFWFVIMLIAVGGIMFVAFHSLEVFSKITIPLSIRSSFVLFLIYIALLGVYWFLYEFFFRGFVLMLWKDILGYKAIFAQSVLHVIFFVVTSSHWKVDMTVVIPIAFSLCSGWIAFRSRSMLFSFLFSFISVILGVSLLLVFSR